MVQTKSRGGVATEPSVVFPGSVGPGGPRRPPQQWARSPRARRRRRRLARRNPLRRHPLWSAFTALVLLLIPLWVSLGSALVNPALGSSPASRLAEWTRDHGGNSLVTAIENYWYSHHPPPIGGRPARGAIPPAPKKVAPQKVLASWYLPAPTAITPLASPTLPGEGTWHPAGRLVDGVPAIYEAYLRPDAIHTSLVVGVAWMDTKLLSARLYSGAYIPGGGPFRYSAPIGSDAAASLDAAFNAGFRMNQADGGYYTDGRVIIPLRVGAASLVTYKDGAIALGAWGSDVSMTPEVASVRQNLDLLVDHGKPAAGLNLNNPVQWGFTIKNKIFVWRSGAGITADGALVYVGGPGLDMTSLAELLIRAGAVRAMELDINTDWVNLATYAPGGGPATAENGTDLLPDMDGTPARYFSADWTRDFFTMSIAANAGAERSDGDS